MKPKPEVHRSNRTSRPPSMDVSSAFGHRYNLRSKGPPRYVLFSDVECPICLENFSSPVIVNCGHSFCRACIEKCIKSGNSSADCPVCKEKMIVSLFIDDVDYTKRIILIRESLGTEPLKDENRTFP